MFYQTNRSLHPFSLGHLIDPPAPVAYGERDFARDAPWPLTTDQKAFRK